MTAQLDFTSEIEGGVSGLYLKRYSDGEVLVKIFFPVRILGDDFRQDEAETWLTSDDASKLIEFLQDGIE